MNPQHLSDEAVAACADGVLAGHARDRATRHTAECAECAAAVQVQREAAWALRAAPAPALPSGLFDRLCGLPTVTPVTELPTVIAPDGSTMFSTVGAAALVPATRRGSRQEHRSRPFATTAAVVALAGALTVGVAVSRADEPPAPVGTQPVRHVVQPAGPHDMAPAVFTSVNLFGAAGIERRSHRVAVTHMAEADSKAGTPHDETRPGVTDDGGRHAAGSAADREPGAGPDAAAPLGNATDFERPSGVDGGFAAHAVEQPYVAPPPTVSPAEQAVFGRPAAVSASAPFAAPANERLAPRHTPKSAVPSVFSDAFGAGPDARDGFAPAPGSRMGPAQARPESPWWKSDAAQDPWRDPTSQFWLGGGAVFSSGAPAQLDPSEDAAVATDEPLEQSPDEDLDPPDNVRRGRFGLSTLLTVLVVAVVAGAVGGLAGWFLTNSTHDALHRPDVKIAQADTPTDRPAGSPAAIAKKVGPAVVSIAIQTPDEFAIGSGVVIDSDGDVLTNNHVVSAAAEAGSKATIVVTFSNESKAKATIVGRDPTSDLAVIKVPNSDLTVATLGKSSSLAVGDPVVAIGSPLGLQGTVTSGIVSALDRPVHVSDESGNSDAYLSAIQTDAAINPGNSGGALVNSSNAVIGINSAASLSQSGSGPAISGIGYAIPIDYARRVALQLIHTGKVQHGSLGAQGRTVVSPDPAAVSGAYLVQVSPGGPAAKAGLLAGDTIVVADGKPVESFDQLIVIVQAHQPGDSIAVTYYRKGASKTSAAKVTLGKG